MLNEGEVTEQGTYQELLKNQGAFAEFLQDQLTHQTEESFTPELSRSLSKSSIESGVSEGSCNLDLEEDNSQGQIEKEVVKEFQVKQCWHLVWPGAKGVNKKITTNFDSLEEI